MKLFRTFTILAIAALVMSMKDKMSLEKLRLRQDTEDRET